MNGVLPISRGFPPSDRKTIDGLTDWCAFFIEKERGASAFSLVCHFLDIFIIFPLYFTTEECRKVKRSLMEVRIASIGLIAFSTPTILKWSFRYHHVSSLACICYLFYSYCKFFNSVALKRSWCLGDKWLMLCFFLLKEGR